ncbi:MAG: TlpA disulfide reductase family protein [Tepidanaerobacteraceae bacterium]
MIFRYKALPALIYLAVLLIFALLLSACGTAESQAESNNGSENESEIKIGPLPGYLAPDFELEDLTGQKVRLSSLRGEILVINFWSTSCRYCLQILPDFDEFNRSKAEDVVVLMVNLDVNNDRLPLYIENQGFTFTVLKDERGEAARSYLIYGMPTTIFVDKDGIVSMRLEGPLNKSHLDSIVEQIRQKS